MYPLRGNKFGIIYSLREYIPSLIVRNEDKLTIYLPIFNLISSINKALNNFFILVGPFSHI